MPKFSKSKRDIIGIMVWILIGIYILFFGLSSFLKYRSFDYGDMDLGVHSQTVWNILHGSVYSSILGIDFLGNHAHFILFLIVPVYLLFQSPLTLLFLQTLSLGLAAYPIYLIAREKLNGKLALTMAFVYLIYPALGYVNLFEFHPTVFATLFLALIFYYFMKGDFKRFVLFMFLSLLCQENVSLIIIMVGIYAFFIKKGIRWAALPILSGGVWFWVMVSEVMPYFSKDTLQYFSLYSHLGSSIPEILRFIITHPAQVARIMVSGQNMVYLLNLLMPLSFFPIFDAQILVILPLLAQHMLSARSSEQMIYYHYSAEMIPVIFISAIYGIKRFFGIPYIKRYLRQGVFISLVVAVAIISNICLGPHRLLIADYKRLREDIWRQPKEDFINMVPDQAGVVATFEFLPRLSHRKNLYSFHHVASRFYTLSDKAYQLSKEAEYALLDFNDIITFDYFNPRSDFGASGYPDETSDLIMKDFIENDKWGVVDMAGSTALLKKNYKSKYSLYQVLDKLPRLSNKVSAIIEGELELIGYNVGDRKKNQVEFSFFWKALKKIERDYLCFIDIVDKDGKRSHRFTKPICYRIYPSYAWKKGTVIKEDYVLLLPPDVKDGCSIKMGIFDYKNKKVYSFTSSVSDAVDDDGRVNLRI